MTLETWQEFLCMNLDSLVDQCKAPETELIRLKDGLQSLIAEFAGQAAELQADRACVDGAYAQKATDIKQWMAWAEKAAQGKDDRLHEIAALRRAECENIASGLSLALSDVSEACNRNSIRLTALRAKLSEVERFLAELPFRRKANKLSQPPVAGSSS